MTWWWQGCPRVLRPHSVPGTVLAAYTIGLLHPTKPCGWTLSFCPSADRGPAQWGSPASGPTAYDFTVFPDLNSDLWAGLDTWPEARTPTGQHSHRHSSGWAMWNGKTPMKSILFSLKKITYPYSNPRSTLSLIVFSEHPKLIFESHHNNIKPENVKQKINSWFFCIPF